MHYSLMGNIRFPFIPWFVI